MRGFPLALMAMLGACAQIGGGTAEGRPPAGPARTTLECGDVRAAVAYAGGGATVQLSDGRSFTLAAAPSASGARYANGENQLWDKGDEAMLRTGLVARSCVPFGRAGVVSGTASYQLRIALTPGAVFEATLVDASRQDSSLAMLSHWEEQSPGQAPLAFRLAYDRARIDRDHRYLVRARITEQGRLRFVTTGAFPVLTNGAGSTVALRLDPAGS